MANNIFAIRFSSLYTIVLRVRRVPIFLCDVIGICSVNLYDEVSLHFLIYFMYLTTVKHIFHSVYKD